MTSKFKKPLLLYIIALHLAILAAAAWYIRDAGWLEAADRQAARPGFGGFYSKTLQMQLRQDALVPVGAVVVIGDSLVHGLAVQNIDDDAVNYGISGDTTAGVLHRLPKYGSLARARLIILAIGINDLRIAGDAAIIDNYAGIIEALPRHVPVVLSQLLPVDDRSARLEGYNTRIAAIKRAQAGLCSEHTHVHCLDISPQLSDASGRLKTTYHTGDGLHLSDEANRIWLRALGEITSRVAPGS